jgi:NDP-sugar pyrophosphorylase family protein
LWFDVGRKRDYIEVNKAFLDGDFELEIPYQKTDWGYLGTGVDIDFSKVTLIPPVIIGHNCQIGPGAVLGPYAVIGDDWTIGPQVTIKNSILWPRYAFFTADGAEIPAKERETVDRHRICREVILDGCIIVGGDIRESLSQVTADVLQDGSMRVLPIDFIPQGPRA